MPTFPRPLGNVAKERLRCVDDLLAHASLLVEPQANGERMLEREIEMIGLRVSRDIEQARRHVAEILALKE